MSVTPDPSDMLDDSGDKTETDSNLFISPSSWSSLTSVELIPMLNGCVAGLPP